VCVTAMKRNTFVLKGVCVCEGDETWSVCVKAIKRNGHFCAERSVCVCEGDETRSVCEKAMRRNGHIWA
jgi:hypothetical protein